MRRARIAHRLRSAGSTRSRLVERTTRKTLEFGDFVRAENLQFATGMQAPQASHLVPRCQALAAILLHHPLIAAQAGRAPIRARFQFVLVEVRITCEQLPTPSL